jgi:hypothetical protein
LCPFPKLTPELYKTTAFHHAPLQCKTAQWNHLLYFTAISCYASISSMKFSGNPHRTSGKVCFFSKNWKIQQKSNKFQNVFLFRTIRKSSKNFVRRNFEELCLKKESSKNFVRRKFEELCSKKVRRTLFEESSKNFVRRKFELLIEEVCSNFGAAGVCVTPNIEPQKPPPP